jgi:hypothetical protein
MKSFILSLQLFFLFLLACNSSSQTPEFVKKHSTIKTVSYIDLNRSIKLTGALNIPLGTIVKLKCKIVDGDKTEIKQNMGLWLMKILEVDGIQINDNIVLDFNHLTDDFTNDKSDEEKNTKIKENKVLELTAYETGKFTGLPDDYMNYTEIMASTDFYFKTSLVIIKIGFK